MNKIQKLKTEVAAVAKAKAKGVKRRVMTAKDHVALALAQTHLPQGVPGGSLRLETRWHQRWRASYPSRKQAPLVKTAVDHAEASQKKALNIVLRWVWESHVELGLLEVCPWELDV